MAGNEAFVKARRVGQSKFTGAGNDRIDVVDCEDSCERYP